MIFWFLWFVALTLHLNSIPGVMSILPRQDLSVPRLHQVPATTTTMINNSPFSRGYSGSHSSTPVGRWTTHWVQKLWVLSETRHSGHPKTGRLIRVGCQRPVFLVSSKPYVLQTEYYNVGRLVRYYSSSPVTSLPVAVRFVFSWHSSPNIRSAISPPLSQSFVSTVVIS
jgi:hypothetical protein